MKARAGLVLTGGGARAAYQVGVVKAVRDILGNPVKNPFPILCGTSAGAINATTLAVYADDFSRGVANLLVMPTLDAANISFNLLKIASSENVTIGPILLGSARPVHILTPSATVRRIVNMTALAVADANAPRGQEQTLF